MSKIGSVTVDLGDNRPITIETGKMALLANAAVTVTQGETVVLVTARFRAILRDPRSCKGRLFTVLR